MPRYPKPIDSKGHAMMCCRPGTRLLFAAMLLLATSPAWSMQAEQHGDQLVLSGNVVAGDAEMIRRELHDSPQITTVILRNSRGGNAVAGYVAGELLRDLRLRTAVSGYCYSACSRMFLGGVVRAFTDDYPAELTRVGFHGHYDHGVLDVAAVARLGLRAWIIDHTDGKADSGLVARWVNIPLENGGAYFLPAAIAGQAGASAFLCNGDERVASILQCEPIRHSAVEMGIATTDIVVHSNDASEVRNAVRTPPPSDYASVEDVEPVPLTADRGRVEYRRFLCGRLPRAFAIAPGGAQWAWNGGEADAVPQALRRCRERAGQACRLYAVDNAVVWPGQP